MAKTLKGKGFMMSVLRNGEYAPICVARNVTINIDGDVLEASKPENGTMRTYFYGWNTYKISVEGLVSIDPTQFTQSELEDLKLNRQVLSFKCEDSANPDIIYSGDLLINNIEKSTQYNDMQTFTMNCQGSGDLIKSGTVQDVNSVRNIQFTQTSDTAGTITFEPVGDATEWQYRFNGGPLQTTSSTSISLTGINSIRNSILITPSTNGNGSAFDFIMVGICYSGVTSLTVTQLDSTSLLASWVATSSAVQFKWEAGGQSGIVTATSIVIPNLSGAITVKITPLCSNNVLGEPMSKSYTMVQTCNSAILDISYTQGVDAVDVHFVSSGTAATFEYQVNGSAWVSITEHDFQLTGLVPLDSYTVVIRPKCLNGVYGQSATLSFTATGALLKSIEQSFVYNRDNCTGNSLGTEGAYVVPAEKYSLMQSTITTIGDDIDSIGYPAFITDKDRTGVEFWSDPNNISVTYPIDDAQTGLESKKAFLLWANSMDAEEYGQNYVNGSQSCQFVPMAIKCPVHVKFVTSGVGTGDVSVTLEGDFGYDDSLIDGQFTGLETAPQCSGTYWVYYTDEDNISRSRAFTFTMDPLPDGKGYLQIFNHNIVGLAMPTSANVTAFSFGGVSTHWRTPLSNIQVNQITNS